jgi:ligand-binding sensor domain-containing protein
LCGLTAPDDAGASPWRQYWRYGEGPGFVRALFKDGDWLWVGTRQGLVRLDLRTLDCTLFEQTDTTPNVSLADVQSMALDPRGCLWANGTGGLVRNCAKDWGEEPDWRVVPLEHPAYSGLGFDAGGNLRTYYSWGRGGEYLRYEGHEPPEQGEWSGERTTYPHLASPDDCNDWFSASMPLNKLWFQSPPECRALLAWRRSLETLALPAGLTRLEDFSPIAADGQGGWCFARRVQPVANPAEQYVLLRWTGSVPGEGDWLVVPWPFAPPRYDTLMLADEARSGVWIGVSDGLVFSAGQTTQKFLLDAAGLNQAGPFVRNVVMDRAGRLWAATRQGLLRYDAQADAWQTTAILHDTLITPDDQGGLWAVSHYIENPADGGYISHYDGESWKHHSDVWPCAIVTAIAADVGGGLWLTGPGCGLLGFDGQQLAPYQAGFDASYTLLIRAPDGTLFAASPGGAQWILRYDGANWEALPQADPENWRGISALAVDQQGGLWVGHTQPPYLHYFAPVQGGVGRERQAEFSDAVAGPVLALAVGVEGDLWVGVEKALLRYDGASWHSIPAPDSFTALAEDGQGRVWAAGLGGFYVYDPTGE